MTASYKYHLKETALLAYPVVFAQLGHIMLGVVDSMMVGGIGAEPLAAAAVSNGVFFILMVIGLGISYAMTPLVAIKVGEGKPNECGDILKQGFITNLAVGLILAGLIFIVAVNFHYFNQPKRVTALSIDYLKIIGVSAIPFMVFQTYRQYIEGFSLTKPAMFIILASNIINFFVNWLLIYGKWGFPELGLNGAGYATLLSRVFMAVAIVVYALRSSKVKPYNPSFTIAKANWKLIKKILSVGVPSGFQYFFETAAFSLGAVMIGWIGAKDLAAHQIAINLASITYMAALGVSAAGAIRVGGAFGRKDKREIRTAGFTALLISVSFMACAGLTFIALNNFLPRFYISDEFVISKASMLLVMAALFQMSDGAQAVGLGILRGLTDVKIPTLITFIAYWILSLPIGYVLSFHYNFGVVGVWIGFIIGLTASAVMLTIRFNLKTNQI